MSDRYGRRYVLLWIAVLFALTSIATAIAWNFPSFLAARFIGGLAVGAVSLVSPMYISEVAPAPVRGRLGALYQMSIVTGILVSYCINYLLHDIGADNWRWMFATGVIPSVIFFGLLLRAPETPRFLFMTGRRDEARAVMERLGDSQYEVSSASATAAATTRHSWREMFQPGVRRAVFVGFWLAILIHFSGINTVIDYAPVIFLSAGWQLDAALLSTFVVGLTNFAFTLVAFWTIDRYGRRPLYIVGSLGMTVMLAALTIAVLLGHFKGPLALVLILGYLIFFCFVHRPGVLDAGAGNLSHPDPRHGDDRARAHTMGGERRGGPVVPRGIASAGSSADIRDPGGIFAGAGAVHMEVRAGDEEPDTRGDREILV